MTGQPNKILVTGALGQIGSELILALREKHGGGNVIASDIIDDPKPEIRDSGPYELLDVTNSESASALIEKHNVNRIFHMAAILSAKGEKNPELAWDVNINGMRNILEMARQFDLERIFVPSSIAVFGPETPKDKTPQETVTLPRTMYGITKVTGELLCDYYARIFNVDVRGCRYPGIISHETLPGGGTTDYAVTIFYEAVKNKNYTCFVKEDTLLPMMYMPDCLKATMDLMDADLSRLRHHANFNITGMSFTAGDLVREIQKHIPEFTCEYEPDYRQGIAESWPRTIDDSAAREEWGWRPDFNLASMTEDMLRILSKRYAEGTLYC